MQDVKKLKLWNESMLLVKDIYELVNQLPSDEKYGLNSQIKRCSISIPSNIAEGAGRNSNKEFIHFLSISNGSCFELQTQLELCKLLKLLDGNLVNNLVSKCVTIQKMNFAFQKVLGD